jgi:DNA-binding HxlR family transcriptional regulator
MSVTDSEGPVDGSCHESGAWRALGPSDSPTADDPIFAEDPLEKIEGRWTLQILVCLSAGGRRFSDLRSAIPRVSANILTDRLRALESAGIVERHYLPPPHASHLYVLAGFAAGLKPVLDAIARWRAEASPPAHRGGRVSALGRE